MMELVIRNETEADYFEVEDMTRDAFWNLYVPGCEEHYLVHILRGHKDFIPELDCVALHDGKIVGSIFYTKSSVVDESGNVLDTLTFGPLCVKPEFQRKGVGRALIQHTKEIAIKMGYPAIIIYGSPHNYCVHGFKNCRDFNIANGEGRYPYAMLVLELKEGIFNGHQWKHYETPAFFEIDHDKVEEFDRRFKHKEKGFQYSQVEFMMSCRAFLD